MLYLSGQLHIFYPTFDYTAADERARGRGTCIAGELIRRCHNGCTHTSTHPYGQGETWLTMRPTGEKPRILHLQRCNSAMLGVSNWPKYEPSANEMHNLSRNTFIGGVLVLLVWSRIGGACKASEMGLI
ncbi:hypothetical protein J1614_003963 [Plenodomus biglobosus]|nr:hypothetical protein J1614_003963 [Plenodomus biglobosus]